MVKHFGMISIIVKMGNWSSQETFPWQNPSKTRLPLWEAFPGSSTIGHPGHPLLNDRKEPMPQGRTWVQWCQWYLFERLAQKSPTNATDLIWTLKSWSAAQICRAIVMANTFISRKVMAKLLTGRLHIERKVPSFASISSAPSWLLSLYPRDTANSITKSDTLTPSTKLRTGAFHGRRTSWMHSEVSKIPIIKVSRRLGMFGA